MTRKRLLSTVALLAALSLVVAACGQKANVGLQAGGDGGSSEDTALEVGEVTESGQVVVGYDEQGNAILADAGSAEAQAALAGKGGGSTTRTGGTRSGSGATTTTIAGPAPTKVWGNTITIGIHAPITGAAPLPASFQAAAKFVKDYYNSRGGIHGRTIEIVIEDDQYQPAVATQKCTEMVKGKNAFLLIGAAGTDQIQACARWSASNGIPYLSAGVTERGLTTLKNYFAISMSYKAQVPYLVNWMKSGTGFPASAASDPSKVFMVYSDTPNFRDAVDAWKTGFPGAQTLKLSRVPSQSELNTAARQLCDPGKEAKLAFPLMAPSNWIFLIGQMTCKVQWAGIGVTMGVNEVAGTACKTGGKNFNGSTFFSPFPNKDEAPNLDSVFKTETSRPGNEKWDDIWIALWATTKGMAMMLDKVGKDLSRAKFVTTAENTSGLATGLGPILNYSPTNHFGAKEVHVLKAKCTEPPDPVTGNYSDGTYTTAKTFLKY